MSMLYYVILYKYVSTCFDQLYGHLQAKSYNMKFKIRVTNFFYGQTQISVLLQSNNVVETRQFKLWKTPKHFLKVYKIN
jgi:hypothetical protein